MAGIGFELRRLATRGHYTGLMQAYASAAIISAGPWIISILSLMLLSWMLHRYISADDVQLFTSSITHVYAFALVLSGPIQLVLTRCTSDYLSAKNRDAIFPSFLGSLILTTAVSGIAGSVFFLRYVQAELVYQIAAVSLFVHVACIFVASTYLSALREYNRIVAAFFIGYGVGVVASCLLAERLGVAGAMLGFLVGHIVLFIMLASAVYVEFGRGKGSRFTWLKSFLRFPDLMLCGLFYNMGIWVDKFLFWWLSQSNVQINGALHAAPDYDLAIYLSLLSIAPGIAVFFLHVETTFAERYQAFYDAVQQGKPLSEIVAARHQIMHALHEGFYRLLKVQGLTTALLVVFADNLASWFGIGYIQTGIFRITLFGAMMLVVFLCLLTVLFYFDDRRGALICSVVFFIANALLSVLTLLQNEAWYGFGFVIAAGLATFIATHRVNRRIEDLEYNTFCRSA